MQAASQLLGRQQAASLPCRQQCKRITHVVRPVRSLSNAHRVRSTERVVSTRALNEADSAAPAAVDKAPEPLPASSSPSPSEDPVDIEPEVVFYEGPGSNAELVLSILLLPTLIYAPLSIASIGRRLWISFKFTNKRLTIINTSPLFRRTIEVAYKNIKEIRTGPRAFGLWGDMVVFLRDGSRLELTGLEKYKEIAEHINRCIYTL